MPRQHSLQIGPELLHEVGRYIQSDLQAESLGRIPDAAAIRVIRVGNPSRDCIPGQVAVVHSVLSGIPAGPDDLFGGPSDPRRSAPRALPEIARVLVEK